MPNVRVSETNLFGQYLYKVMVDGETYDFFFSDTPLSYEDQRSVEAGYEDGLDNYQPPSVELSEMERLRRTK